MNSGWTHFIQQAEDMKDQTNFDDVAALLSQFLDLFAIFCALPM